MLSCVLLNVIEPARPVDSALNLRADFRCLSLYDVKHSFAFVKALNYAGAIKTSGVAGLAATGGIERGAVKRHGGPTANTLGYVNHTRVKFDEMRVGIVEPLRRRHVQRLRGNLTNLDSDRLQKSRVTVAANHRKDI